VSHLVLREELASQASLPGAQVGIIMVADLTGDVAHLVEALGEPGVAGREQPKSLTATATT
jgi:hypothetical protein